jgi:hypothetical protein
MKLAADLAQPAELERVVHVRRPRFRLDQSCLPQPLHVVHDRAWREGRGGRQLLDCHALAFGEQPDDA